MPAFMRRIMFGLVVLSLTVGFTWLSALPAAASLSALPTRVRATLTPTATRTPTAMPTYTPTAFVIPTQPAPVAEVGYIHLMVHQAPASAFAVVQWQDGLGGWNLVEGWQTQLPTGQHTWAVLPTHFGQGPFRWVVYDRPGGKVIATSARFTLPGQTGQIISLTVTAR